ncbi:MAG: helix-turn-helix transcriptional regulator [Gemmatimonadaceae bacterium]|nr:helix-turn-helix transcriptional regulator [Gemmatimonadaceae bacterium]
MRRPILLYGLVGGLLVALLKLIEYRYLIVERSFELYGGLLALIFVSLGLWVGRRLTSPHERVVIQEVPVPVATPFVRDEAALAESGLTRREVEILEQLADGLSTREIAERVFVSENTVKTHLSRVYEKLGARRRTQAVQVAKARRLIP